jgi:hypothetical protein
VKHLKGIAQTAFFWGGGELDLRSLNELVKNPMQLQFDLFVLFFCSFNLEHASC